MRTRLATCVLLVLGVLFASGTAQARGCREQSDIVGLQHCTRYGGDWALESQFPILAVFGLRYGEIGTSNLTFTEDIGKPAVTYRFPGSALGQKSLNVIGMEGGFQFFVWRQLYFGVEGILSVGASPVATIQGENGVTLGGDSGVDVYAIRAAAPLGYRIALGRAALRPELDFGVEQISVGSATATRGVIEPRLNADFFLTPHISFGVYGAYDVLDGEGRSRALGFAFTWHNRAFDGDTSF